MSRVNESKTEKSDTEDSPKRLRGFGLPALPSSSTSPSLTDNCLFPIDENNHRYVGLVNQAMTCYLNSLVQSLYMTPEFRNAMYEWEYVSSQGNKGPAAKKGESSIPCQLQKLFLLLQTTENDSLETRDLTASFGWSASEAYDQHDVQELCRLMFDALEHKWKGTKHEKLIQNLYRGTMEDFVKCLQCGKESVKTDYFLDLPLAVKPFGAMSSFKSVEEALRAFIQPELLDGSNQYNCENCQKKQDAHKGLRITQFPYLLTIQLKRFDFDYNTMHRIKLNDRMTFPDVLDLNSYIYRKEENTDENGRQNSEDINFIHNHEKEEQLESMEFGSPPTKFSNEKELRNPYLFEENGEVRVGQTIDKDAVDELLGKGDNIYELFSVMVHSGSASGGHYYAYIKNMEQDKWFSFNDVRVDCANVSDIERSFGGHSGGWNTSNTNAYMLMYRKIDRKRNSNFVHTDKLPTHIKNLQEKWKLQEQEKEEQRQIQQSLLKVEVRINYPLPSVVKKPNGSVIEVIRHKSQIEDDFIEYVTEISRNEPIQTVFTQAWNFFNERAKSYGISFPSNQARLIFTERKELVREFLSKADRTKPLKSLFDPRLPDPVPLTTVEFLLDCRVVSTPFLIQPRGGRLVKIKRVDVGNKSIALEYFIYISPNQPILRAKQIIGSQFGDDIHDICEARFVVEGPGEFNKFLLITPMMNVDLFCNKIDEYCGRLIPTIYYDGGMKLMCNEASAELTMADRKVPFETSTMFKILERKHFSSVMRIRFPSQNEIARAATTCEAYNGPSWIETDWFSKEDSLQDRESTADDSTMATEIKRAVLMEDEDICESGRGSTASMRSVNVDDLDEISGSLCNNTPQMSPSVSEGGEYEHQFNTEGMLDYIADQMVVASDSQASVSSSTVKAWKTMVEDNASESQSMASSGQSTVVPSTSTVPTNEQQITDYSDGKIMVISANEAYWHIDVDNRLTIGEFKQWIAEEINLEKSQFVLMAHISQEDNGIEKTTSEEKSISVLNANIVSIKLRPPLKENEKMMPILLFDLLEENRENWKTLFEIPASPQTYVGDILLRSLRLYKEVYGEELTLQQVRLRNIPSNSSSLSKAVLNPNDTLDKSGSHQSIMYMQIISDESLIGKPGDPIFVRRFRPSTAEVGQIREVLVDPYAANQVLSFLEALSSHSNIPIERLAVTDGTIYCWGKWPYSKSRLEMLDGKVPFIVNFHETSTNQKDFISKVGSRVIYYKDMDEKSKTLSEEERKQIKIKENGQSALSNRRKERPLRIQMSSVSEA